MTAEELRKQVAELRRVLRSARRWENDSWRKIVKAMARWREQANHVDALKQRLHNAKAELAKLEADGPLFKEE